MSALADLLEFYTKEAWDKDEKGAIIPSAALLADQGKKAASYMRPNEKGVPPIDIIQANYMISIAEIAEALRDLAFAANMPPSEARNVKIGALCVALQKCEYRLRMVTRS